MVGRPGNGQQQDSPQPPARCWMASGTWVKSCYCTRPSDSHWGIRNLPLAPAPPANTPILAIFPKDYGPQHLSLKELTACLGLALPAAVAVLWQWVSRAPGAAADGAQLERSMGRALPECPGSPQALPWAGGHEVGGGEALGPGGGGWRPGGAHSAGSRQLRGVKACVLPPFSEDVSRLAPGLLDIHSASRVLSTAEADVALSLQQGNAFLLEPCSELSTCSFDKTTFS